MIFLRSQRYLTPLLLAIIILLTIHLLSVANYSVNSSPTLTSHTSNPSHHTLPPPPEYPTTYPSDPNEICEANHGLPYLSHIAQNHIPYCDISASKSGLECFKTIHSDLLCVGQGITYKSRPSNPYNPEDGAPGDVHRPFRMHCKMRNLTQERMDYTREGRADMLGKLEGFLDRDEWRESWREYMYDTGLPFQLESWRDGDGKTCNKGENDGTYTLLIKREMTGNIWHRLLEVWQVKLSLDAVQMSGFLGAKFDRTKVQFVFQDDIKGPWDELLWPMITGSKPLYMGELEDGCLGTVILPLPGSTSPFWWKVWEDLPCRESFLLDPFIKAALKHMGLDTPPRLMQDTTVTVVNRTGTSNTRQLWNIDSHAEALRQSFPGVTVQVLDFAAIDLREQISIIRNTDVLLGTMGAGLTHLFFLNEESTIAEIIAPGTHYAGFRNLAKIRKMPYFVTHGVDEKEFIETEDYRRVMGANAKVVEALDAPSPAVEAPAEDGKLSHAVEELENVAPTAAIEAALPVETPTELSIEDESARAKHVTDLSADGATEPAEEKSAEEGGIKELFSHADDEGGYQRRRTKRGSIGIAKRHWQDDPYLYLSEKQFIALAAAAINAQGNRGTRMKDIYPH